MRPISRRRIWIGAGLLAVFAVSLGAAALAGTGSKAGKPDAQTSPSSAGLAVVVDPRMELLSIIQRLAGYKIMNSLDFRYKRDVDAYFASFKDHPAVAWFAKKSAEGFAFGAPVEMILCLSNPPELAPKRDFTEFSIRRAGSREALEEFAGLLRRFAAETNFADFLAAHQKEYAEMVGMVRSRLEGADDVAMLEKYYGQKQRSYTFVFAPLIHGGGYGVRFGTDGAFDIYSLCGSRDIADDRPQVRPAEDFRYLLWHEFSHSFVNPATGRSAERFAPYVGLLEVIKKKGYLKGQEKELGGAPLDLIWGECLDEHIVRAVTTRLAFRVYGAEARDRHLKAEVDAGFIFTPDIARCLERYEARRDRFPSISDFYEELADAFGEIARREGVADRGAGPGDPVSVQETDLAAGFVHPPGQSAGLLAVEAGLASN